MSKKSEGAVVRIRFTFTERECLALAHHVGESQPADREDFRDMIELLVEGWISDLEAEYEIVEGL